MGHERNFGELTSDIEAEKRNWTELGLLRQEKGIVA
jgi:hypothetical protein